MTTDAIGNNSDLARLLASLNAQATARSSSASSTAVDNSVQASGTRDFITLSTAAQAAAALWDRAGNVPLNANGDTSPLDAAVSDVEDKLRDLMNQLGITGDFEFTLSVQPDGSVKVDSDDPRAAKLEEAINADPDLRKDLVSVHRTASAQRIATAMSQALAAARSDTSQVGDVFNWVRDIIDQTKNANQVFTYSGGSLTTSFVDADGNRFGVDEGLSATA